VLVRETAAKDLMLRRQYAAAIRRMSAPGVLKCIAALLPRRPEKYEHYMMILGRAQDAGIEALVEALIAAPSITHRRVFYDGLLTLGSGAKLLIHMLGDRRWYVVRNAAELLGEMRVVDADAALTALLEHPDDRVRAAAAGSLAKLGAQSAVKGVRLVLRDAAPDVRQRAAEALANGWRPDHSAESLIRAFDKEQDSRVQMAIVAALGQIASPAAVDKLAEIARTEKTMLRHVPTPLRVAAVQALGMVRSPTAIAAAQALLRDRAKEVRGAASWVLMGRKRDSGKRAARKESEPKQGSGEE
jgi:HEAT repeat protein